MKLRRVEMRSFEEEDVCSCGAEIVFRPPLPRFFWMMGERKVCDGCGTMAQAAADVVAVEMD